MILIRWSASTSHIPFAATAVVLAVLPVLIGATATSEPATTFGLVLIVIGSTVTHTMVPRTIIATTRHCNLQCFQCSCG